MLDNDLRLNEKADCELLHLGEIDRREFNRRNQDRYAEQEQRLTQKRRTPWWQFWKRARK